MFNPSNLHKFEKYKELALGIILLFNVFLALFVNLYLGIEIVYTHLFYIPIILAGIWYHKKAIYVALCLGLFHISLDMILYETLMPSAVIRAILFIVVALVVGQLSELKDKLHSELESSNKRLSDVNEELSHIIEFYPDATLIIDNFGKIVAWNKAMEEMTGIAAGEMIGKGEHIYALPFYGQRRPVLIDLLNLSHDELKKEYDEVTYKNGKLEAQSMRAKVNGRDVVLHCIASRLYDSDGKVIGAIESIRDVTEQNMSEEALKRAREELEKRVDERTAELDYANSTLQTILDTIPTGVVVVDAGTGDVSYYSHGAADMIGTKVKRIFSLEPEAPYTFLRPDNTPMLPEEFPIRRSLNMGENISGLEMKLLDRDGKEITVLIGSSPILDNEGRTIAAVLSMTDITERKKAEEALRESEEKFRNIIENINDWVWESNARMELTYVSPKVVEVLGYRPEDMRGKTALDFMAPDEAKRVSRLFYPIISGRLPYSLIECTMISDSGRPVVFETSGTPIFDNQGAFRGYRGISRDITERIRAEKDLKKSESRIHALLNSIPDLIFRMTKDGTFLDYKADKDNDLFMDPEDILGKNIYEVLPVELSRTMMYHIGKALKTGEMQTFEYIIFVNGEIRYEEARCIVSDKNEVFMMVRDITDLRQNEESIKKAYSKLEEDVRNCGAELLRTKGAMQNIIDALPVGIIVVDASTWKISHHSQVASDIFGGSLADDAILIGKTDYELLKRDGSEFLPDELPLTRSLKYGEITTAVEMTVRRADGSEARVLASSSPIIDANGKIISAVESMIVLKITKGRARNRSG
ncbi:hypothetical protein CUJ83_03235 [Methanocella sp. CWC-04]|uniref:histidine kinase n=1 Tax=Methanooceanicella nereidis TaxID=2052831 RepID=A0AAP2RBI0_9EURY|nr:PAS domain S-box protein [Methanocella sp. CWC-04]MCD1294007.1 hypothetical protein [Methanocella sp. CWC-04]